MFDVIATGRWLPGQVHCTWSESTFHPSAAVQELIDAAWSAAVSRPGVYLFDGSLCRLEGIVPGPDTLELRLSRTTYKPFLGTNMTHPDLPQRADPVGLSVALESADGMLLLGRRNERVAYYPSRIHPFAGAMEPDDAADVFAGAMRELKEELSLAPAEVDGMRLVAIVADRQLRQPELIFLAKTTRTRDEIEQRLDLTEHRGLVAIRADGLDAALADESQWTPVGVATATFWGREVAGARRATPPPNLGGA
jgi:hypothetical protein